ncbi:ATP-dependent zinc metalloprotease FtsH [Candidatus Saccharibacteria bacterium]|nr:ATP-dependent zinc metalloprotease FtsH [Candidatus Saccharibacteria bacterium]
MNKKPRLPQKQDLKKPKKSDVVKNAIFWGLIIVFVWFLVGGESALRQSEIEDVSFSVLKRQVENDEIGKITEQGQELIITRKDADGEWEKTPSERSRIPVGASAAEQGLDLSKVEYESVEPDKTGDIALAVLTIVIPVLLIGGLMIWMMRGIAGQNNQSMSFGRSKAKLYGTDKGEVKFIDIAGNAEAKEDLFEVVDFLRNPKKYENLGAKIPRGVLLVGPPGTGKTMIAKAVAGEAKVPFFSISGSEFVEMFVGVGASRVRDMFEKAKKNAPCIIFVDEIDAVGRRRGSGMGGGHDEREQTLNQILVEMDGFEKGQTVIVLAATNRVDVLDPALLRPGRFDRRVAIDLPERKDREAILRVHFKNKPLEKSVDLDALSAKTAGSSGADLANVANEAAIIAAKSGRKTINNDDVTAAFEKVAIGPERKSKVMNEDDKKLTAYHEAGHALVGHVLPDSDPVHKVTIIARGHTGGVTWFIPPEDRNYTSIIEYKDMLARLFGGRLAEEIVLGRDRVTTGASSDLRSATDLARDMIIEQGMGTKLRNKVFHEAEGGLMFDKMTREKPYSEKTAEEIDAEVEVLLDEASVRAREIINANRGHLDKLAEELLAKETLEAEEVSAALKDAKLPAKAKLY